jgi:flagellar biosynthesis/type III secretory pathway M-ring protein FliF/YscJ
MYNIDEKDLGWQITVGIVSNTIAMVFVIIGAVIAFFLKKYILIFLQNKKEKEENDQEEDKGKEIDNDNDDVIKP